MMISPRQARDKHRENSKKRTFSMNQMPRNAGGVEPYTAHIPQGGWFAAWSNFTAQVKTTLLPF